jgi:hypothetical protein
VSVVDTADFSRDLQEVVLPPRLTESCHAE